MDEYSADGGQLHVCVAVKGDGEEGGAFSSHDTGCACTYEDRSDTGDVG